MKLEIVCKMLDVKIRPAVQNDFQDELPSRPIQDIENYVTFSIPLNDIRTNRDYEKKLFLLDDYKISRIYTKADENKKVFIFQKIIGKENLLKQKEKQETLGSLTEDDAKDILKITFGMDLE